MRIHFIGIGGIGISALAKYYLKKGHQVTGSDLVSSEITDALKKQGAKIYVRKHKSKNLSRNIDLIIYSPAVSKSNPELKEAYKIQDTKYEIQIQSYPEALGVLTKKYFTIAVSGTHGKSTTTAMIGLILRKAGFDPTVIVGTKLKEFDNSNCRVGKSKYLVIEADEHFASFLNYWPKIIVLTTIEREHLDFYKNFRNIIRTYQEYLKHLPVKKKISEADFSGVVANKDDKGVYRIISELNKIYPIRTNWYSLNQNEVNEIKRIIKVPGIHNVSNALAAFTAASALKIPHNFILKSISDYNGSWRRFENFESIIKTPYREFTMISDYGHHPTEIQATLQAAREKYKKRPIWLVYQPHQYQRTYYLFKDFVRVFKEAAVDRLIITDIYDVAGREEKSIKKKINSEILVRRINNTSAIYLPLKKIREYLCINLAGGEVMIIMGAGDIYKLAESFPQKNT